MVKEIESHGMGPNKTMPLLNDSMVMDIVLPPAVALVTLIFGLMIYSLRRQPSWWGNAFGPKINRNHNANYDKRSSVYKNGNKNLTITIPGAIHNKDIKEHLLTNNDLEIIRKFQMFQNNPVSLLKIAIPAMLSIAICPFTIFLQPIMLDFFYPYYSDTGERKDINDALAVFLLPAGLVYAMSFGFALQDSFAKLAVTTTSYCRHMTLLNQTKQLIQGDTSMTSEKKMEALRHLCRGTTHWMQQEMGSSKACSFDYGTEAWTLLRLLRKSDQPTVSLDAKLRETLVDKLLELDTLMAEGYRGAKANITTLLWAFLEILGFIAFVGVLLTSADSYRAELAMCLLTVLTVSAFLYILGDLDHAYHGTFRVELGGFVTFLEQLSVEYEEMRVTGKETAGLP